MGARNQEGIVLLYQPARLPRNSFLGIETWVLHKRLKIRTLHTKIWASFNIFPVCSTIKTTFFGPLGFRVRSKTIFENIGLLWYTSYSNFQLHVGNLSFSSTWITANFYILPFEFIMYTFFLTESIGLYVLSARCTEVVLISAARGWALPLCTLRNHSHKATAIFQLAVWQVQIILSD